MPNYYQAYKTDNNLWVHQKKKNVELYDVCRHIDSSVIEVFIDKILESDPITILEAGVGNGRLFHSLAKKASSTTKLYGIDISEPMLEDLKKKINNLSNVTLYQVDLRDKQFFKKHLQSKIDCLYTFAVIHIISEGWQEALDNLLLSLKPRGTFILGEEINAVFHYSEGLYEDDDYRLVKLKNHYSNPRITDDLEKVKVFFDKYHELRAFYNTPFQRVNGQALYGDVSPVERYLRTRGLVQKTHASRRLRWLKPHTFEEIIDSIEQARVTQLGSDLSVKVREDISKELRSFVKSRKYNITRSMSVPSEIQLHIFTFEK